MKTALAVILALMVSLFSRFPHADAAYAENESDSPIHEMSRADRCSVITMTIRELAASLKDADKEISVLDSPGTTTTESERYSEQQTKEQGERLEFLQKKASSLRKQIALKEQQLDNCLQETLTPQTQ